MAGMMPDEEAMQGGAPQPPAGQPMQAANDNTQVSPEEQAQYDQFVGRAMELIYNQKLFPQIVEMLRGGADEGQGPDDHGANGPARGLAQATTMVLSRVGSAVEEAGQQITPDVLFYGGSEIFAQLADISDKAGISDYANDRDTLEAAYFLAIDMVTQQMAESGELDQEGAKAAMQKLVEMDANGELEKIFLDLDAKDKGGAKPEAPVNDNRPAGMAPKGV